MVRKADVVDRMLMDEAEGFLLEHALFSPPRTWPPLPPAPIPAVAPPARPPRHRSSHDRLAGSKRRMDWDEEMANRRNDEEDKAFEALLSGVGSSRRRTSGSGAVVDDYEGSEDDANSERCVICLMALRDRTIVGVCGHEFCFECIGVWANQSRRCPLCSADMAPFLLHDLDIPTPTKFYLPPLPSRAVPSLSLPGPSDRNRRISDALRRDQKLHPEQPDDLDEQVERRREIYLHELYVKHIASNRTTRFRPNPTPRQISDDPNLIQRATTFMRRELRVWSLVDVEFLTTYILSLLRAIDIRSEPAIRLLAEFLDSPTGPGFNHGAEHFAHEIYSFLRSPFKELARWDAVAQYDPLPTAEDDRRSRSRSPVPVLEEAPRAQSPLPASASPRGRPRSRSRSPSPAHRRSRSRSFSDSPRPRSRSRSRSRSPLRPRDPTRRDTYIPAELLDARKWYESDSWVDPDYQDWLDEQREKAEERASRRRARRMAAMEAEDADLPKSQVELLPSPPLPGGALAMEEAAALEEDDDVLSIGEEELLGDIDSTLAGGLSIRGAADPSSRRLALLERLALAKAQGKPALSHSISDPLPGPRPVLTASLRAKLRLRLKLESEKASLKHNINESKAQELRRRLLEARERRARQETDATLKQMDRLERAAEIRRRLMVAKMMAAETEGERKQRELKEKLVAERRRRMLKELLLARKRSIGAGAAAVGTAVQVS